MANIRVPGSESMLSNEVLPNIQLKQAVRELVSILICVKGAKIFSLRLKAFCEYLILSLES